jgi:hypothetical protein
MLVFVIDFLLESSVGIRYLSFTASQAPVAQLDRASDYGSEGYGFESFRARQHW